MRKRKKGRKLSRPSSQRRALLLVLARSLFLREKIETTQAKAKELSRFAEKLITKAKKTTLSARRELSILGKDCAKKLIELANTAFKERKGGYTRILKLGQRKSNGTKMAIIELVK